MADPGAAPTAQPAYEYHGLRATYWDLLRGDTSQWSDRSFFLDVVRASGEPVLDVACGTGRLLLDFLAQGMDADGVDNSPEMLALCRARADTLGVQPALYEQPMEGLDLPRTYRTIIVSPGSFQLVIAPDAAAEALRRFHAHLEPSGTLVIAFMLLWTGKNNQPVAPPDWWLLREKEIPGEGAQVRYWIRYRYDIDQQLEHTEDRYDIVRDGVVVTSEYYARLPATRWYTQAQARALFEAAGFTNTRLLDDETRALPAADADVFFVLGTR